MPKSYTKPNGVSASGKVQYKPDPKKYLYNVDTLWLNADVENYDEIMEDGLLNTLVKGREFLLDTADHQFIELHITGYENPLSFKIFPGDPPMYQYSIRNDDIAIYFSKKRRDNYMPMRIQINQFILWEKGIKQAYFEALCVLSALGFVSWKTQLNRVDFAVHSDQWQWNLKDLQNFDYPRNIADDNKPNFWRLDPMTGDFQTVYYGDRKRCQLRIYNKSIESKRKKKQYFLDLYEKLGMDKDNVWNVEIEVRRPFIKECKDFNGQALFDDFELVLNENRLSDLWSYLMCMYKHPSPHWKLISVGSPYNSFYKVDGYELTRIKDLDSNFDREVAQIAGRLKLAVIKEEDDISLDNAIEIFKRKYKEIEVDKKKKDWISEVKNRKQSFHNYEINKSKHLNYLKNKKITAQVNNDLQTQN